MRATLKEAVLSEDGTTLIEYGLMIALVALIAFIGVQTLGAAISSQFGSQVTQSTGTL